MFTRMLSIIWALLMLGEYVSGKFLFYCGSCLVEKLKNCVASTPQSNNSLMFTGRCVVTSPSEAPIILPTSSPTFTVRPSPFPSLSPSVVPTYIITRSPSAQPTISPSTATPTTAFPSMIPSIAPTRPTETPTRAPTAPTVQPSFTPTYSPNYTFPPTMIPSANPTVSPSVVPSFVPSTVSPSTRAPSTKSPSRIPTTAPSRYPSETPSMVPSEAPSVVPTMEPTYPPGTPSRNPSFVPTAVPTISQKPTQTPTKTPTFRPSTRPPTELPTSRPTAIPTSTPKPSKIPTLQPSPVPSSTAAPSSTLRTLLSMDLTQILVGVDATSFASSESAQMAFVQAVVIAVPFLDSGSVTVLSSTDVTGATARRRQLRFAAAAVTVAATNSRTLVEYNLLFYIEGLGYSDATLARSSVYSYLNMSVSSGSFAANLISQATLLGVSDDILPSTLSTESLTLTTSTVTTSTTSSTGVNSADYNTWPVYGKVLLPVGGFVLVCILSMMAIFVWRNSQDPLQQSLKDASDTGPAAAAAVSKKHKKTKKSRGTTKATKGDIESGEINDSRPSIEQQFTDLMLADEFYDVTATTSSDPSSVSK